MDIKEQLEVFNNGIEKAVSSLPDFLVYVLFSVLMFAVLYFSVLDLAS